MVTRFDSFTIPGIDFPPTACPKIPAQDSVVMSSLYKFLILKCLFLKYFKILEVYISNWWWCFGALAGLLLMSAHLWLLQQRLKHNFWCNCDATVQLLFSILVQRFSEFYKNPPTPKIDKTLAIGRGVGKCRQRGAHDSLIAALSSVLV